MKRHNVEFNKRSLIKLRNDLEQNSDLDMYDCDEIVTLINSLIARHNYKLTDNDNKLKQKTMLAALENNLNLLQAIERETGYVTTVSQLYLEKLIANAKEDVK